jgi:hypothetical protein
MTTRGEAGKEAGTAILFQGPDYWYQAYLLCLPNNRADAEMVEAFRTACDTAATHLIETFEIP